MKRLVAFLASLAAILAVGLIVVSPAASAGPREDPHKTLLVSADQAKQEVLRIAHLNSQDIAYKGTRDRPGIRTFVFEGPKASALVDVSDGHVSLLQLPVPQTSGDPKVTTDQAQRIAIEYLKSIGSPIDGLAIDVRLAGGGGTPAYTVQFYRTVNDIVVPDARMVELDAVTGQVFAFGDIRRPFTDPGKPRITGPQAMAAAVALTNMGKATGAELQITWDKEGNQLLIWQVRLKGTPGDPGIQVSLDANSGAAVDLAQ